jgi:hypothetical protein
VTQNTLCYWARDTPNKPRTARDRGEGCIYRPRHGREEIYRDILTTNPDLIHSLPIPLAQINQQQSSTTTKLSDEQWQALIALRRTLPHEHHDFFLASQHHLPLSPALRRLAIKYVMPARMWRHGIHSFLELLGHQLPDSFDRVLIFVYLAYSMMALLESVPSFEETWIEHLGNLARYRMAMEEADLRDCEI